MIPVVYVINLFTQFLSMPSFVTKDVDIYSVF